MGSTLPDQARKIDLDGATPMRSDLSAHTAKDPFFIDFVDLVCDGANRIRKRRGKGAVIGATGGAIRAIHEFEYVNPATGAVTLFRFRAHGVVIERESGGVWSVETMPPTFVITSSAWSFLNFKNRCIAVNGTASAIVFDGTEWRIFGIGAPAVAATYNYDGASVPVLERPYSVGTITANKGVRLITGVGSTWNAAYNGKPIYINGVRYTIESVTAVGPNATANLTETFKEESAVLLAYTIYPGLMDWATAPRVTWAWYKPTTGHVSNVAPVTQITDLDQVGRTLQYTIAGSAANTAAFNQGYTKIRFFRSVKNGNTLAMVNWDINNNNTGAAIVFVENSSTFNDAGLTNLLAPINTNTAPPQGITAIAEWGGRVVYIVPADPANSPPNPPLLGFSTIGFPEIPFGRGEESMPALYFRNVNTPTGLVTIGGDGVAESLVIQTERGDFSVRGYDNLTITEPFFLGTRRSGGFRGGAIDVDGQLVEFYRDKQLIDYSVGEISDPIRNKLKTVPSAFVTGSRLTHFSYEDDDFILLSVPKQAGSTVNDYTYVWDRKRQRFYEWNFGFSAAARFRNPTTGNYELWVGDAAGNVYKLLQDAMWRDAGADFVPRFKLSHLKPFGEGVDSYLSHFRIYVNPAGAEALTWQLKIYKDEDTVGVTENFVPATTFKQSAQGRELVVDKPTVEVAHTWQFEVLFPTANTDLIIEQASIVFQPAGKAIS